MRNKGIIHCDIKPENILFTDENADQIKIIDFGASCENYSTGFSYVQSRMYRAPEIVLGAPYDHSIDMWSLGCLLFEMTNECPLFPAQDENELLEFFTITLGHISPNLIKKGRNHPSLYKSNKSKTSFELIRSPISTLGPKKLIPRSQTIEQIISPRADKTLISFLNGCLVYDPERRMTPEKALNHPFLH